MCFVRQTCRNFKKIRKPINVSLFLDTPLPGGTTAGGGRLAAPAVGTGLGDGAGRGGQRLGYGRPGWRGCVKSSCGMCLTFWFRNVHVNRILCRVHVTKDELVASGSTLFTGTLTPDIFGYCRQTLDKSTITAEKNTTLPAFSDK